MIPKKNALDLQMLRESGVILARVIKIIKPRIRSGITTIELDRLAEEAILKARALPAFKGYKGYPATLCVSVNDEIVHGIPGQRKLAEGDIASIDLGVNYRGYFTDAAFTVPVGRVTPRVDEMVNTAQEALRLGLDKARCGNRLFDISYAIQVYVEGRGFSVVRQFVGHGIGTSLHEEPEIPNFGRPHQGPVLEAGMVLAIEPMVNMGGWEAYIDGNGWTAKTKDGLQSAHFEHTVAITPGGPEVLTE
ncbi:MAG: type I methionyl aminopeptidase [Candidatus Omnitrophota bacterium]|nr:type I methionyl aminopeptidase [Candidatus Omnitrophota bacterium]